MEDLLQVFKSLSDRNRFRIICILTSHERLCACQITDLLNVKGATSSRHLQKLVHCNLISSSKEGRWVFYRLNRDNSYLNLFFPLIRDMIEKDSQLQQDIVTVKNLNCGIAQEI
ncbi:MAG: metalloregulator ArsR/SmtB family transcription factor [Sphaerochaetaceae bacterium]|nr:metalloregulator ArsR/SmtB family transcription factor [Sphaerochaetaceae bacterium]